MSGEFKNAMRRKGSFGQTVKAVGWSFFGVRKGSEHQKDVDQLNPVHLVVAGLIAGALFVGALLLVVNWVIASGVAT
ncbi:MAG: DUF2970 domain-containing protein [Rhizobiales bacterium]|nr:DUF2970 domain-containing protein [Rhizobacter sp.]